jgi:hypothetical protein
LHKLDSSNLAKRGLGVETGNCQNQNPSEDGQVLQNKKDKKAIRKKCDYGKGRVDF